MEMGKLYSLPAKRMRIVYNTQYKTVVVQMFAHFGFKSTFSWVDKDPLRKPNRFILPPLCVMQENQILQSDDRKAEKI